MKFYTIFSTFFANRRDITSTGADVAVFRDIKTGRYYCGGARLTPLIFTNYKKAQAELSRLARVEGRLFWKTCYIREGIIRPL